MSHARTGFRGRGLYAPATRRDRNILAEARVGAEEARLPLPHRSRACSKLGDELLLIQNCMCEWRGGDRGRDWRTHRARCILFSNWDGGASRLEVSPCGSRSSDWSQIALCPNCRRKVEECWTLQRKNKQDEVRSLILPIPPPSPSNVRSYSFLFFSFFHSNSDP